jgi:KUP system potassium uptake protein
MMVCTVVLTIAFVSSDRLAGAYGTAVSTTMLLTTVLLYRVMHERWGWRRAAALTVTGVFLIIDLALFGANLMKIREGGWVPLAFGALVFLLMTTWRYGIDALRARHAAAANPLPDFFEKIEQGGVPRVPGTAVFLTRATNDTPPPLLIRHVEQIGALQQTVVALTVKFADVPRIAGRDRVEIKKLAEGFWRITAHFGFVQVPNLPAALRQAKASGCPLDLQHAIFFHGRDTVVARRAHRFIARIRILIFAFMLRNSVQAVDLFLIPTDNFIEIGRHIEI